MKKLISYGNFEAPTTYSSNSIIGGNPYSFNHSYNSASYQIGHANCTGTTRPQNFYSISKQSDATQRICQNFNNGKDCPPTCQYNYLYRHCAGSHPAKDCPSNTAASGSNFVSLWYQWLTFGIFQSSQPHLPFYSFSISQSFLSISESFFYFLTQSNTAPWIILTRSK